MRSDCYGKKVLVVEDDEDARLLLVDLLKRAGLAPIEAGDGEEALALFRDMKPDLVILDVMLPKLDGWEVLKRIKSGPISRKIPVIMLTARDRDSEKAQGYTFGADFYLTKPYNVQNLLSIVERSLTPDNEA